jgi:hypothetical protein
MSPMQQMLLGSGGKADKIYIDDLFSTYLYKGTGSAVTVNNGIDLAGKGGMTWIKSRTSPQYHSLIDTVRGPTKAVFSNHTMGEDTGTNGYMTSFNNNGFTTGNYGNTSQSNQDFTSWSFAKSKGFFDVVTYTGNGSSSQTVSHSLGCIPGMMIVKKTSGTGNWNVYHRGANKGSNPAGYRGRLNLDFGLGASHSTFDSVEPTATTFELGTDNSSNASGDTYIAYLFAGGESTAATARSVDFDGGDGGGTGDALTSATSSDLSFGTGDYTVEFWFNCNVTPNDSPLFENRLSGSSSDATGFTITAYGGTNGVRIWWNGASRINGGADVIQGTGKWHHIAATRSSGTTYLFLDGTLLGTTTDSINITTNEAHIAGGKYGGSSSISHYFNGKISNFRIVKGTAVYTSSFKPSYEPLTNITNTKLLCCNNSSTTGSTVAPGTITAVGDPTASTDSPFDDPAGFVFGENEDQNVIKCGRYVGNGSSGLGPVINLGWEPQFVLIKRAATDGGGSPSGPWRIHDSMRGVVTGGYGGEDPFLEANDQDSEDASENRLNFTPTGFLISSDNINYNDDGDDYVFVAIRRSDGYVGKPPLLGTNVFAMDTGNSSSTIPVFDSNFIVDFALERETNATDNWDACSRLFGKRMVRTNLTGAFNTNNDAVFDSNTGWNKGGQDSDYQSWMWKRSTGFDALAYKGDGSSFRQLAHSMNNTVEMIWTKNTDSGTGWRIWHKDLNGGGSNAAKYYLDFEVNNPTANGDIYGGQDGILPTSTHYTVGGNAAINQSGSYHTALLFASSNDINGNPISKVGSYTGNGSASGQTITLGFQPKFIILKAYNNYFFVWDTTRGWGSGNDPYLILDLSGAGGSSLNFGAPTSTGFTVTDDNGIWNGNGTTYLYYAHA